jgi:hypothetical protein
MTPHSQKSSAIESTESQRRARAGLHRGATTSKVSRAEDVTLTAAIATIGGQHVIVDPPCPAPFGFAPGNRSRLVLGRALDC